METERLTNASGFFISSITTLSLAVMLLSYIRSQLISLFEFSFIIIIFLASLYLRYREFHKVWNIESKSFARITSVTTLILGVLLLAVFLYFGVKTQDVTFPLSHYSLNPYFIAMGVIWLVYSIIEISAVNKLSDKYSNFRYLAYFSSVLTLVALITVGYVELLLPIALLLVTVSTFISGIRIYYHSYNGENRKFKGVYRL
ncbi:MAG: hypothetical protein BJBARM5_1085 [Candidatus Parvarchaeum acidophilus ARMAN-5]|jgi:hypothetical protein|uniref:Uncharacterized protein n=1 Tax=Candidatus Parvarchaeum acidophilus ARMAN-5 TaxID=662762 RepID=D6GX61_PARA5|nr:MAG: hypothetical protein BJBARM5_1085 [Candidatus Parvarchaeum acidophilus ARMAN-5]